MIVLGVFVMLSRKVFFSRFGNKFEFRANIPMSQGRMIGVRNIPLAIDHTDILLLT